MENTEEATVKDSQQVPEESQLTTSNSNNADESTTKREKKEKKSKKDKKKKKEKVSSEENVEGGTTEEEKKEKKAKKKEKKSKKSKKTREESTDDQSEKEKQSDTSNIETSEPKKEDPSEDTKLPSEPSTRKDMLESKDDSSDDEEAENTLKAKLKDESELVKQQLEKKKLEKEALEQQEQDKVNIDVHAVEVDRVKAELPESSDDESETQSIDEKSPARPKRQALLTEKEFNENTVLDLLITIRTCALGFPGCNKPTDSKPIPPDFTNSVQYKVSRTGEQKRFVVKDFAPLVFKSIREKHGITLDQFLKSWATTDVEPEKSTGKSDSKFLFSTDKQFVLKTISQDESKVLRDILPDYYYHIINNERSFLMKIYAHHRINIKSKDVYFIVFNNIFYSPHPLDEMYDLKGATYKREVTEEEKSSGTPTVVQKDNEFVQRGTKLQLQDAKDAFLNQIDDDCKLLEKHGIMDYSLLVGVRRPSVDSPVSSTNTSVVSTPNRSLDLPPHHPVIEITHSLDSSVAQLNQEEKTKEIKVPSRDHSDNESDASSNNNSSQYYEERSLSLMASSPSVTSRRNNQLRKVPSLVFFCEGVQEIPLKASSNFLNRTLRKKSNSFAFVQESTHVDRNVLKVAGGALASVGEDGHTKEYYYIGVIDILQKYNGKKRVASLAKYLRHPKEEISTVDPVYYASRFKEFITKQVVAGGSEGSTTTTKERSPSVVSPKAQTH